MIEQIKEKILAIIENHRKLQNNVKSFNPDLAMGLQALIDEDNYILSAINSMPKSESDVWHNGKDRPPFAGKEILVRRGDKNYYGKYIGGARRFVCAEIRLTDDTAETYAIINYMSDDDKWAYLDDLITYDPIFKEPRFKYNEKGYSRFENKLIEFRNNTPLISVNYRQGKGVGVIKRYAYELLKIAEESIIEEPASEMWHDNKEMPSDKRILAIDCNGIPYVGYSGGINPNMVDRWVNFDNFINFANSVAKIKEKSESKDLDLEVLNYWRNELTTEDVVSINRENFEDIARHFANWQKEQDIDEIRLIRELLENFDKTCDEYHDAGFKHGQEALMKDAVEGYAYYDYTDDRGREMLEVRADEISAEKYNITDGEKVKVIIIKKS